MLRKKDKGSLQGGSKSEADPILEKIWKSNCPNKVKHFIWRFAHNNHPLRKNLQWRGMKLDTKCPVCDRLDEDGAHLFFKCKMAKQIWRELKLEKESRCLSGLGIAHDVIEHILKSAKDKLQLMFIGLWFIWTERNLIREEGRRHPAEAVARAVKIYTAELDVTVQTHKRTQVQREARWARPPEGYLKLNCDASFIPDKKCGGWGFFIRDCDGDVVLCGWGRVNHLLSAFQAEAIACLQGIQAACTLGIGRLIVETDALKVKQALSSDDTDLSVAGGIIEELRFIISTSFSSFECVYIPRNCNKAAHVLAAVGVSST